MGCRYDISYICQFIKVLLMDYDEGVVRVVRNRRESSRLRGRKGRETGRSLWDPRFFLFSQ